jgi:hypothetical protein
VSKYFHHNISAAIQLTDNEPTHSEHTFSFRHCKVIKPKTAVLWYALIIYEQYVVQKETRASSHSQLPLPLSVSRNYRAHTHTHARACQRICMDKAGNKQSASLLPGSLGCRKWLLGFMIFGAGATVYLLQSGSYSDNRPMEAIYPEAEAALLSLING